MVRFLDKLYIHLLNTSTFVEKTFLESGIVSIVFNRDFIRQIAFFPCVSKILQNFDEISMVSSWFEASMFQIFELEGNQLYRNMQTTFCMLEIFVYMHYNAICYQKSIANLGITWSFPRDLIQHEMLCGIRNTHKVLNAIWRPWHTSTRQFIADINILCRCWWKYHFFKIDRLG